MRKLNILLYSSLIANILAGFMIIYGNISFLLFSPSYYQPEFDITPFIIVSFAIGFQIYFVRKFNVKTKAMLLGITATILSVVMISYSGFYGIFNFFGSNFSFRMLWWFLTHTTISAVIVFISSVLALLLNVIYFMVMLSYAIPDYMQKEWYKLSKTTKIIRIFYLCFIVITLITSIVVINLFTAKNQYLQIPFWKKIAKDQILELYTNNPNLKDKTVTYTPSDLFSRSLYIYSPLGLALKYSNQDIVDYMLSHNDYAKEEPITTLLVNVMDLKISNQKGESYENAKRSDIQIQQNIKKLFDLGIKFTPALNTQEAGDIIFGNNRAYNDKNYQYLIEQAINHGLNISSDGVVTALANGRNDSFTDNIYRTVAKSIDLYGNNTCFLSMKNKISHASCTNIFLILSASNPNMDFIKMLQMCQNVNFNQTNNLNQTPLMYAAYRNDYEYVKFLLENGANPLLKDSYSKTAFDYALEGGIASGGGLFGDNFAYTLNILLKYINISKSQFQEIVSNQEALMRNTGGIKVKSVGLVDSDGKMIAGTEQPASDDDQTQLDKTINMYKTILNWDNLSEKDKAQANIYCNKYDWKICKTLPQVELKSYDKVYCKISYQSHELFEGRPITPHITYKEFSPAKNLTQCYKAYKKLRSHFQYDPNSRKLVGTTTSGRSIFAPKLKITHSPIDYDVY